MSPAVADMARLYKQQQETAALLEEARKLLPVPYRDDGPPLAFEFDDIPGAPSMWAGLNNRSMRRCG